MSAIGKTSQHKDDLAFVEKQKIENMNSRFNFLKNNSDAKVQSKPNSSVNINKSSDSKISNFVRGFRREATDFSLLSKRHSAALPESLSSINVSPQKFQRSSALFQRNKQKGEPILTDYSKCSNLTEKRDDSIVLRCSLSSNPDFHRIRREKTESVISLIRNQDPISQQQVIKDQKHDLRPTDRKSHIIVFVLSLALKTTNLLCVNSMNSFDIITNINSNH
jgi:hypothetical protein